MNDSRLNREMDECCCLMGLLSIFGKWYTEQLSFITPRVYCTSKIDGSPPTRRPRIEKTKRLRLIFRHVWETVFHSNLFSQLCDDFKRYAPTWRAVRAWETIF